MYVLTYDAEYHVDNTSALVNVYMEKPTESQLMKDLTKGTDFSNGFLYINDRTVSQLLKVGTSRANDVHFLLTEVE